MFSIFDAALQIAAWVNAAQTDCRMRLAPICRMRLAPIEFQDIAAAT
jgi:hypothetical protein